MARSVIPLTDTKIKKSKPQDKKYKLSDGGGLFLLVNPNGSKWWRFAYRYANKQKEYAIGVYPDISLKDAREKRSELRSLVADGQDISQIKKIEKEEIQIQEETKQNTFQKVALEWYKNYADQVSENYHEKLEKALDKHVFPYIGRKPISEVSRKDIISILQKLKDEDLSETANRIFMLLNKIYMYAVTTEKVSHNITADVDKKVILGKRAIRNFPTFTKDEDIKALLVSIDDYQGEYTTKKALQLLPYVFVRSFNIRHMEWEEIDFDKKLWTIPASKMKMKKEFVLPLSKQAMKILKDVKSKCLSDKYVFPSYRYGGKPMSDNTMNVALKRMGFSKDEFVPHGFRSMFSTLANEKMDMHGFSSEVIEALLAHEESNKVKAAYNRAKYLEPKTKLIQWYADYLDSIKQI